MRLSADKGISLLEIVISLAVSSILIAGSYATFRYQQKTHSVQEQVVDMQQNMRVAVNRLIREIRGAGFGNVSMALPATFGGTTFNSVINPDTPANGALTVLSAYEPVGTLADTAAFGENSIIVNLIPDAAGNAKVDLGDRRYISIGGVESYSITSIVDNGTMVLTVNGTLLYNHPNGTPVFGIRAVTYQIGNVNSRPCLQRDEHLGNGFDLQADDIEAMQFTYFDANDNPTANPADIRLIRVALTARTDSLRPDADLKTGDGYRRREIASNVRLRNMDLVN